MYGQILKILETTRGHKDGLDSDYCGYLVQTNQHSIFFGICDSQQCCEDFGYLTTLDNVDDFVGAEVLDVTWSDLALNNDSIISKIKNNDGISITIDDCVFLTIKTDKGDLQLVVYNYHNGYYGHQVRLMIDDHIANEACI